MKRQWGIFHAIGAFLAEELFSISIALGSSLVPAYILANSVVPIPHWPVLDFRGWVQVQLVVYCIFRVFYTKRKAAR